MIHTLIQMLFVDCWVKNSKWPLWRHVQKILAWPKLSKKVPQKSQKRANRQRKQKTNHWRDDNRVPRSNGIKNPIQFQGQDQHKAFESVNQHNNQQIIGRLRKLAVPMVGKPLQNRLHLWTNRIRRKKSFAAKQTPKPTSYANWRTSQAVASDPVRMVAHRQVCSTEHPFQCIGRWHISKSPIQRF